MNPKPNKVIAIDPGPEHSAMICWSGSDISVKRYAENADILSFLRDHSISAEPLVIEQVASYGMPVVQRFSKPCSGRGDSLKLTVPITSRASHGFK